MNVARIGLSLAVLLLALAAALPSRASELTITPGVRLSSVYDDNLYLQDKSDFEFLAAPQLTVNSVGELTRWKLRSTGEFYQYVKRDEFNRVDQNHTLDLTRELTPLVAFTFAGGYTRDHSFDQILQIEGVVTQKIVRDVFKASPGLLFNLTERDKLNVSYGFASSDYQDPATFDYTSNGIFVTYEHQFRDGKTSTYTQGSFQRNNYERKLDNDEGDEDLYLLMQGIRYKINELWLVQFGLGLSHLRADYTDNQIFLNTLTGERTTNQVKTDSTRSGLLADALLRYNAQQTFFELGYSRTISESVQGESITSDTVRAGLVYNFTERWALDLGLRVSRSESQIDAFPGQNTKNLYTNVRPTLRYLLEENTALRFYYDRFDRFDIDNVGNDESAGRNRFGIELQWDYPFNRTY